MAIMENLDSIHISVVIPFRGHESIIYSCLLALSECEPKPAEVIIVENSAETKPLRLDAYPLNIRLLNEPEPGPGPARNAGAFAATADIVAFLDQDCEPIRSWTKAISEAFKDSSVDIVGGEVLIRFSDKSSAIWSRSYQEIFLYRNDWYIEHLGFSGTGNLAVRRSVFEKVGPFSGIDRNEERDWGKRASVAGYKIKFLQSMAVWHPSFWKIKDILNRTERECAFKFLDFKENHGGRVLWLFSIVEVIESHFQALIIIIRTNRIQGIGSRILAWTCRLRVDIHDIMMILFLFVGYSPFKIIEQWREQSMSRRSVK